MQPEKQIHNISSYKFIELDEVSLLRDYIFEFCDEQKLKGTILLSKEGININLAGHLADIEKFITWMQQQAPFADMDFKRSLSETQSFDRLKVKIKDEIIAMRINDIDPIQQTGTHLSAKTLEKWYDDNKDMLILDTRNTYEIALGTFDDAIDLSIETFREFPQALSKLDAKYKDKPVVTFCTGGVRCEKATAEMLKQGFKEVYQLTGGILKYFEECGDAHYHGECFVFDDRVSVDGNLDETDNYKHLLGRPRISHVKDINSCSKTNNL